MRLSRETIALRLLCALIAGGSIGGGEISETDIRMAFNLAAMFERISEDVGGRPIVGPRRKSFALDYDDDDS